MCRDAEKCSCLKQEPSPSKHPCIEGEWRGGVTFRFSLHGACPPYPHPHHGFVWNYYHFFKRLLSLGDHTISRLTKANTCNYMTYKVSLIIFVYSINFSYF